MEYNQQEKARNLPIPEAPPVTIADRPGLSSIFLSV